MNNRITMKHDSGFPSHVVKFSVNCKPVFIVGDGWLFVPYLPVSEEFTYTLSELRQATEIANNYMFTCRKKF